MRQTIAHVCSGCNQYGQAELLEGRAICCPRCEKRWGTFEGVEKTFQNCPICGCNQFYLQKDFNQVVGCLVMLVGIILVPFTFGLSLPVFAAVDWMLYRQVATIAVCYQCGSEFRGFTPPEHLKSFMHHIGVKYDKKPSR